MRKGGHILRQTCKYGLRLGKELANWGKDCQNGSEWVRSCRRVQEMGQDCVKSGTYLSGEPRIGRTEEVIDKSAQFHHTCELELRGECQVPAADIVGLPSCEACMGVVCRGGENQTLLSS